MEQNLATLLRVVSAAEIQIDIARASLAKSAKDAFKLVDTVGRNILSSFEISQFLEKNKVKMEQDEGRMIVQYYDLQRKGKLDPETFQKALTPRSDNVKQNDSKDLKNDLIEFFNKELDLIRKTHNLRIQLIQAAQAAKTDVYKVLDKEDKGELTFEDIDAFLQKQGVRMVKPEIQAILQRGDRSGNNILNQQDFEYFIVPDVTNKKVLAKEPELSPIVEARDPIVPKLESPQYHNNFPSHSYSQTPNAPASSPLNNMLTVSQIVEKYDTRAKDYKASSTGYTPYTPGYEPTPVSYLPSSNKNVHKGQATYSSHLSSQSKIQDTPYYPGMYADLPLTQSQVTFTPNYLAKTTTNYNFYDRTEQDLRANRYLDRREPVTKMSRSLSSSLFGFAPPKPYEKNYEKNYEDFSPSKHRYDRQSRELVSTNTDVYQNPPRSYETPVDRSYVGPRSPAPYNALDYSYRVETPKKYPDYVPNYTVENPRNTTRASPFYSKRLYEDPVSRRYDPIDHLRLTSDIFNRDGLQQTQGLRDWGVSTIYTPSIKAQGSALYDHSHLRRKYDNLSRSRVFA